MRFIGFYDKQHEEIIWNLVLCQVCCLHQSIYNSNINVLQCLHDHKWYDLNHQIFIIINYLHFQSTIIGKVYPKSSVNGSLIKKKISMTSIFTALLYLHCWLEVSCHVGFRNEWLNYLYWHWLFCQSMDTIIEWYLSKIRLPINIMHFQMWLITYSNVCSGHNRCTCLLKTPITSHLSLCTSKMKLNNKTPLCTFINYMTSGTLFCSNAIS